MGDVAATKSGQDEVFLINRLNSRYVRGNRDASLKPAMRWLVICIVCAAAVFIVFFALFVFTGGAGEILLVLLPTHTTDAAVTNSDTFGCGRNHLNTCYTLTAAYSVGDRIFVREQVISEAIYLLALRDGVVPLTYALALPQVSHIGGVELQTGNFVYLATALVIPAIILIPLWMLLAEYWRIYRYRRRGALIYGSITRASGKRQHVRTSNYFVTVHYTFTAPDEEMRGGKVTRSRKDLEGKPLPAQGTRCAVLYVGSDDYLLL